MHKSRLYYPIFFVVLFLQFFFFTLKSSTQDRELNDKSAKHLVDDQPETITNQNVKIPLLGWLEVEEKAEEENVEERNNLDSHKVFLPIIHQEYFSHTFRINHNGKYSFTHIKRTTPYYILFQQFKIDLA